jgi:hypothetical protein
MNIIPQAPNLSIPTVLNPHTESLRRENNQREVITQPAAASQSAAEKGVASDRERSRTPAQQDADIDFASITEKAELANSSIAEHNEKENSENNQEGEQQNDVKGSPEETEEKVNTTESEKEKTKEQERLVALEQKLIITELKQRDQEVRAHEAAHASVGGSLASAPSYTFERGPDGKKYAVAGEVSIDISPVNGDPRATIAKMQKVHSAALAPAEPSSQDISVASTASQLILKAQSELLQELASQAQGDPSDENSNSEENQSTPALETSSHESQSEVTVLRSLRIESFYSSITHAYDKEPSSNFELRA